MTFLIKASLKHLRKQKTMIIFAKLFSPNSNIFDRQKLM
jgi:hypothetical protein